MFFELLFLSKLTFLEFYTTLGKGDTYIMETEGLGQESSWEEVEASLSFKIAAIYYEDLDRERLDCSEIDIIVLVRHSCIS